MPSHSTFHVAYGAGEFYARVHQLSIIIARIGWFVRNENEAEAMWLAESGDLDGLEAGSGFSVYLSHDDAGRFYQACVESTPTKGECITTFVTSKQPTARCELSACVLPKAACNC